MYHEAHSEFLFAGAYVSQCVIIVFCEMLITNHVPLCSCVLIMCFDIHCLSVYSSYLVGS